ncbi:TolB family protein [Streptomyces sp. CA-249302]|uniref:TolB family protein n=1 Tax=Streptomyces sp. CA-249302 TaxID=3240058 RepID=UPI003D930121
MRRLLCVAAALTGAFVLAATPAHAAPAGVQRVSLAADGTQLTAPSSDGVVSATGRYAVFVARSDACTGYGLSCALLKDLRTGGTQHLPNAHADVTGPAISADGRIVGYTSGVYHFFHAMVYDRHGGATQELWPANPPTDTRYERSDLTALSADGEHAAYTIGNRSGNNGSLHLFVRDLTTGADEMIDPVDHPGWITGGRLSTDGRFVAYGVQTTTDSALYVEDRTTGETRLVATGTSAVVVQVSADGRRVLYNSRAQEGGYVSYVHDLRTGRDRRVADVEAEAADAGLRHVLLSGDDGLTLLDRRTGRREAVAPAGSIAVPGSVTRGGRAVAFTSASDALVPDDTNGVPDVFLDHIH